MSHPRPCGIPAQTRVEPRWARPAGGPVLASDAESRSPGAGGLTRALRALEYPPELPTSPVADGDGAIRGFRPPPDPHGGCPWRGVRRRWGFRRNRTGQDAREEGPGSLGPGVAGEQGRRQRIGDPLARSDVVSNLPAPGEGTPATPNPPHSPAAREGGIRGVHPPPDPYGASPAAAGGGGRGAPEGRTRFPLAPGPLRALRGDRTAGATPEPADGGEVLTDVRRPGPRRSHRGGMRMTRGACARWVRHYT
jgi:hypothetical protein